MWGCIPCHALGAWCVLVLCDLIMLIFANIVSFISSLSLSCSGTDDDDRPEWTFDTVREGSGTGSAMAAAVRGNGEATVNGELAKSSGASAEAASLGSSAAAASSSTASSASSGAQAAAAAPAPVRVCYTVLFPCSFFFFFKMKDNVLCSFCFHGWSKALVCVWETQSAEALLSLCSHLEGIRFL